MYGSPGRGCRISGDTDSHRDLARGVSLDARVRSVTCFCFFRNGKRQDGQDGQDGEDDSGGSTIGLASGLKRRGEQPLGTPPSPKAVPPFISGPFGESDAAAASVIFVILLILSILSPAVPRTVAMSATSLMLGARTFCRVPLSNKIDIV